MPDNVVSTKKRSRIMSSVRQKNTALETTVRKVLFANGYRFRVNVRTLPGTPDIVLPKYRTAIFVHGCFWHQHRRCRLSRRPTSNSDYWNPKLDRNVQRDQEKIKSLKKLGWKVIVVWGCELKAKEKLVGKLKSFLLVD